MENVWKEVLMPPVVWQRKATKRAKIYNARAYSLLCSLNLLFSDVFVAVVVVGCLSSLPLTFVSYRKLGFDHTTPR